MKVFVTVASDDYWYTIKEFKSFQDFVSYSKYLKHGLVLSGNFWYGAPIKDIMYAFRTDAKKAEEISKLEWNVIIYDSYIE